VFSPLNRIPRPDGRDLGKRTTRVAGPKREVALVRYAAMRVLHVPLPLSPPGNTLMRVVSELGRCQTATGSEVGVIVSDNRDVHLDGIDNLAVDYTAHCPRQWFTRSERLADDMRGRLGRRRRYTGDLYLPAIEAATAWRPDLILLYEGLATAATVPDWRQALPAARIVLYMHSQLARAYGRAELVRSLAEADAVVFVSQFLRSHFVDRVPALAGKSTVVENGVDRNVFHPDQAGTTPQTGAGASDFQILFVGQVAPHKGPDLMLRAVAAAQKLTPVPLRASVVGSSAYSAGDPLTDYERSLRHLATSEHLDVEFVPFVAKQALADRYRRASVSCVPSIFDDPFPLVASESMACGTALVASRRGGLPEVAGDAARYVDPEDTAAFAAVIADLAEHPDKVERMGRASLRQVDHLRWETTSRRIAEVAGAD
jgi:glycosyltransferase involved in cell wall biosynthesis